VNCILAFESSCDDTSVALVGLDFSIICNLVSTQLDHSKFGGVLPELASRLHLQNILRLTDMALSQSGIALTDVSAVAVSINPGLIGSLIVGLSFAKSLAWTWRKPLVTVNHMLSHIFANFFGHPEIEPPFLALVVSGGHTELVHFETTTSFRIVGKTLDDAAGETFDKTAKLLGLGYPGGPALDRLAKEGNPDYHKFPRAINKKGNFNFSYSGLKTSLIEYLSKAVQSESDAHRADLAASIQQAIIDPLITKSIGYAQDTGVETILLAGGVAANSALREQLFHKARVLGIQVLIPALEFCVDNAAMVGAAAIPKYLAADFSPLTVNAFSQKGTRSI
jgi:N6-L-threonylcarbamoyladenine synthase